MTEFPQQMVFKIFDRFADFPYQKLVFDFKRSIFN